ncbi:MAG: DUF3604 domain-containing protein [Acidobacteriota bacterium]|nr:DUF3604 domain-containing protein [Acidobacteriota bacterium]
MARRVHRIAALAVCVSCATAGAASGQRNAYFGDLHIHTRYSFDAFVFGTRASPDDAYSYARGEAIKHPAGYRIQLDRPLDFYAVTDHGMYLGAFSAMTDPAHPLHGASESRRFFDPKDVDERRAAFRSAGAFLREHPDPGASRSAWREIIESAERNYEPGKLTTFVAYEFTSSYPPGANQHRNVIFRGANVPDQPFSRLDSPNPEDLWDWLEGLRARGIEALAIPHNSNQSDGYRFARQKLSGERFDEAYARLRMRNEPLVEMTQVKGTSETHPLLSPNDEWADFEIILLTPEESSFDRIRGGYVRDAYLAGLEFEEREGFNPYRFGMIGASDSHNAGASYEESSHIGKVGFLDGMPVGRGSVPPEGATSWKDVEEAAESDATSRPPQEMFSTWGASGLAGVWAEENTRESIYDAFRRKETFATTGPRIRVRFFASYGFDDDPFQDVELVAKAYEHGVPMGGDLPARHSGVPQFLVWAVQDPESAKLQRVQVIKGWIEDGQPQESVYDVACSDGLEVDSETHRCPDNGAQVDLADCSVSPDVGSTELMTLWTDPDFDRSQHAFYYLRALENPTCRWSTWDAIRAGTPPRPGLALTLQERAYSSPIWSVPN